MGSGPIVSGGGGWWSQESSGGGKSNSSASRNGNHGSEGRVLSSTFAYFLFSFVVLGSIGGLYARFMITPNVRSTGITGLGCQEDNEGSWAIGIFYGDSPFSLKPIETVCFFSLSLSVCYACQWNSFTSLRNHCLNSWIFAVFLWEDEEILSPNFLFLMMSFSGYDLWVLFLDFDFNLFPSVNFIEDGYLWDIIAEDLCKCFSYLFLFEIGNIVPWNDNLFLKIDYWLTLWELIADECMEEQECSMARSEPDFHLCLNLWCWLPQ